MTKTIPKIEFDTEYKDFVFVCHYLDRHLAKRAGFRWSPYRKVWKSSKLQIVEDSLSLCTEVAKIEYERLRKHVISQQDADKMRNELLTRAFELEGNFENYILRISNGFSIAEEFTCRNFTEFYAGLYTALTRLTKVRGESKEYELHLFSGYKKSYGWSWIKLPTRIKFIKISMESFMRLNREAFQEIFLGCQEEYKNSIKLSEFLDGFSKGLHSGGGFVLST